MNTDDLLAVYVVVSTKGKRKKSNMDKILVVEKGAARVHTSFA